MKNTTNPPGQVTLGDYLTPRYPEEMKKKLTFDEWWNEYTKQHGCPPVWITAEAAWKAAQENL